MVIVSNLSFTTYLVVCYTAAKFTLRSVKFEQTISERTTVVKRYIWVDLNRKQMLSSTQTN